MQPYLQQCYFAFFRAVPDLSTFANCTPEFMKDSWFKSIYLSNIFIIIAIGKYIWGLHLARLAWFYFLFLYKLVYRWTFGEVHAVDSTAWGGLDCMERTRLMGRTRLHGADSTVWSERDCMGRTRLHGADSTEWVGLDCMERTRRHGTESTAWRGLDCMERTRLHMEWTPPKVKTISTQC